MKNHVVIVLILSLAGCASGGPKIDAARLSEIREGEATIGRVMRAFGRPSILSKNIDGTQTAIYIYAEGRSDAPSFIALVGALAGASQANVDTVVLSFDANGVLSGYRTTQARPPAPAAVVAERTQATGDPSMQAAASRPAHPGKKAREIDDKPWTIQLYPSGYRENR